MIANKAILTNDNVTLISEIREKLIINRKQKIEELMKTIEEYNDEIFLFQEENTSNADFCKLIETTELLKREIFPQIAEEVTPLHDNDNCPICMDCISSDTNRVTTECGHCFHTNCLMANVAHNGFGCPYCRTVMAEEPDEDEDEYDEDTISVISVEDSHGETENEYYSQLALRSIRYLFQEAGEEVEDDEDDEDEDEYPKPPLEFLVQKMIEEGFTFERLLKVCLIEHEEYNDIEEEIQEEEDKIFEALRILISNYVAPQETNDVKAETTIETEIIRSSYP